jgi:hypothetical protein
LASLRDWELSRSTRAGDSGTWVAPGRAFKNPLCLIVLCLIVIVLLDDDFVVAFRRQSFAGDFDRLHQAIGLSTNR